MRRAPTFALTVALSLVPFVAQACDRAIPPGYDEGSSISVGRMADIAWVARVVDGVALPGDAGISLTIWFDGRIEGNTGCNRIFGVADLDAGQMTVGPLDVTERACADPARMEREGRYLRALGEVEAFLVTPEGDLYLQRKDGSTAVCLTTGADGAEGAGLN
jgi:heat shock protein HslJ